MGDLHLNQFGNELDQDFRPCYQWTKLAGCGLVGYWEQFSGECGRIIWLIRPRSDLHINQFGSELGLEQCTV